MVGTTGGDEHWFAVVSLNDRLSAIDVPPRRINEIVHGKRSISADTALRLSRHWV
jgi:antitoxin HigA-1